MKKITTLFVVISFCISLCGCFNRTLIDPNRDSKVEDKVFKGAGIVITLTNEFVEKESELGFDAYFVSDYCGVVVLKEDFSLKAGMSDLTVEEYINNVIDNNGHKNIEPQCREDLWFYVNSNGSTQIYSYSFKGTDAFYIVQFICMMADVPILEEVFFSWAQSVKVE